MRRSLLAALALVCLSGCARVPVPTETVIEYEHCVQRRLPEWLRCATYRIPVPIPPPLPPLTPLPSDDHLARWQILVLLVWLSLELCAGCGLVPAPPAVAPAPCLQHTCVVAL